MKENELTDLEQKVLNEIVKPSISSMYVSDVYILRPHGPARGQEANHQDLDFVKLLNNVKKFYKRYADHDFRAGGYEQVLIKANQFRED